MLSVSVCMFVCYGRKRHNSDPDVVGECLEAPLTLSGGRQCQNCFPSDTEALHARFTVWPFTPTAQELAGVLAARSTVRL